MEGVDERYEENDDDDFLRVEEKKKCQITERVQNQTENKLVGELDKSDE